jgi:hypothetical protein
MMMLPPIYRQMMYMPLGANYHSVGLLESGPDSQIHTFTWRLRDNRLSDPIVPYSYTCMNGLGMNLEEKDCTTPAFASLDGGLPNAVADYMEHFARVWSAGATWYRGQQPQPISLLPVRRDCAFTALRGQLHAH